jgi:hypothetical protein
LRRALKAIALRIAFSETTTVSGLMIASASPTLENNRWRPTNIDRSMLLKTGFLGVVRRRTMTCWLSFPKIPSGADSRDEAESAHHPTADVCIPSACPYRKPKTADRNRESADTRSR